MTTTQGRTPTTTTTAAKITILFNSSNSKNNNNNDGNIFRSSIHYGEEGYLTMRLKRNRKLEQQDAIKLTHRLQSRL